MNLDRTKYRYWEREVWNDPKSPLVARYANIVDGCDPTVAIGDFEFCTGVRDKNGTLIYENDIICDRGEIHGVDKEPFIVKWSDRCVGFILDGKTGMRTHCASLDAADSHSYEIIGTAHEQKDVEWQ